MHDSLRMRDQTTLSRTSRDTSKKGALRPLILLILRAPPCRVCAWVVSAPSCARISS